MPRTVGRGAGKGADRVFAAGGNGAERTLRGRGDVAQYPGMKAFFNLKEEILILKARPLPLAMALLLIRTEIYPAKFTIWISARRSIFGKTAIFVQYRRQSAQA